MEIKTAIILAGGFGTRLQSVVTDVPKPMAPINSIPFLTYQFNYLKHFGIRHIVLSVGYMNEKIRAYYQDSFEGITIEYVTEDTPLGTGGGIRKAMEFCKDEWVLALNGDSFFDVDLKKFQAEHSANHSQISLALRKVTDAARYGTIELNTNRINSFKEKNDVNAPGLINGGVYILNTKLFLESTPPNTNFSIEKDFFETNLQQLHINGFEFDGYFIDIGIPEDYKQAQHDFKEFKYR